MQLSTNLMIVIAIVAGVGLVVPTAADIFESLKVEGKSICANTQGFFRNGSNGIICPEQD